LDAANGPIAAFAHDLRALRLRAGNLSYRELSRMALFAPSVLSSAASGHRLPTLQVTLAFVAACGGDRATWERRWWDVAAEQGTAPEPREACAPSAVDHSFGGQRARPAATSSAEVATPAQLPIGPRAFVGRIRELTAAARFIGRPGTAKSPLVIGGRVGVGKSTFALRLADALVADFPDGQLYADLGDHVPGGESTDVVVRGFLRALGVAAHQVPDDPTQRIGLYRSLLAQRKLLVLLENVRDESAVRPLLGRAPHSQVVVTSRARLLGLDGVHRVDLDAFSRAESTALLRELVGDERIATEPDATDAVAGLCDHLPLAVDIVGRRIAARPEWAIAHVAGQLADTDRLLDALSVGDVNVRGRFASAYQPLAPVEKQALHQLALDGVGWTTAIGLAVAMDVAIGSADDLLESLVDAGLLARGSVDGRYDLSTLVSAFAADARRDAAQAAHPLAALRDRRLAADTPRRGAGRAGERATSDIDCSRTALLPVNGKRGLNDTGLSRAIIDA
jgi:hypothetical protein